MDTLTFYALLRPVVSNRRLGSSQQPLFGKNSPREGACREPTSCTHRAIKGHYAPKRGASLEEEGEGKKLDKMDRKLDKLDSR